VKGQDETRVRVTVVCLLRVIRGFTMMNEQKETKRVRRVTKNTADNTETTKKDAMVQQQ